MTLLQEATQAIHDLANLAAGSPDPVSVLGLQARLVQLHADLGQEMVKRFHGKERAYIARKIAQAQAYQSGRLPGEKRLTAADATEAAILAVGEEWNAEADTAAEYEGFRVLLKSLQNAIDFARSLVSFYKSAEGNSSHASLHE